MEQCGDEVFEMGTACIRFYLLKSFSGENNDAFVIVIDHVVSDGSHLEILQISLIY